MKFAGRILIFTSIVSLGLVSCNSSSVEQACRDQLPSLSEQMQKIDQQIALYAPERHSDRAIASTSHKGSSSGEEPMSLVVDFPRDLRDSWMNWSEKKLVDVERYTDVVRTHSEYRAALDPLKEVADDLVKFDGYVDQGKVYQAMATLHRVELNADAVARVTCAPAPTVSAK